MGQFYATFRSNANGLFQAEAPRPVDLPVEGAASLKAAVVPVVLHSSKADPLS